METLGNKKIDKRLNRIERWLKRCMVACKCGFWSSALMEIECMEAETRELRERLWIAAEEEATQIFTRSFRVFVFRTLKVAFMAMLLLLATGLPLSLEQDRPFRGDSVMLLTRSESEIIDALRETLSTSNPGRIVVALEPPAAVPAAETGAAAAAEPAPSGKTVVRPVVTVERNAPASSTVVEPVLQQRVTGSSEPSIEEVLSLIQVGQNALRISEPAIRVVP